MRPIFILSMLLVCFASFSLAEDVPPRPKVPKPEQLLDRWKPVPETPGPIAPAKIPPMEPVAKLAFAPPAVAVAPPANLTPLDLEYLPLQAQTLLAARPFALNQASEIVDDAIPDAIRQLFLSMITFSGGNPQDVKVWPTASEIDQIVTAADFKVGIPEGETDRIGFELGVISSTIVKTLKPFDWKALIQQAFPKVETVRFEKQDYLRSSIPIGDQKSSICFFIPNDKTLVLELDEDRMKALLTRLNAKKKLEPIPGLSSVETHSLIVVQNAPRKEWVSVPSKVKDQKTRNAVDFLTCTETLAFGVSAFGQQIKLDAIFTAKDETRADQLMKAIDKIVKHYQEEAREKPTFFALLQNLKMKQDGKTVRLSGGTPEKAAPPQFGPSR